MKTLAITSIMVCIGWNSYSQQEYSYTQFANINTLHNPAGTAFEGHQKITGIFKKQWFGFNGSPFNGGLIYENELKGYNMGIGGILFNDNIGAMNTTSLAATYSYRLKLNEEQTLAFGFNAGADFVYTDFDRMVYWDQGDQVFTGNKKTNILPKIGIGAQFYGSNYFVGIGLPRLVAYNDPNFISIKNENVPSLAAHYYLLGGYNFDLKNDFKIKANAQVKYIPRVIPQGDILILGEYKNLVGLGLGYKSLGFASAVLQYTFDQTVVVGYAYDMSLNRIASYSSGTHELMVRYNLPQTRK